MRKEHFYINSKQEGERLHCVKWVPDGSAKGVVQLVHGMIEYIDRYDEFAKYLVNAGYVVYGHDHLGHGETAKTPEDFGYFADNNGKNIVIKDIRQVYCHAKKEYPNVPYFLMGHSMGSLFTRKYITIFGDGLDGVIIMGTAYQPFRTALAGRVLATTIAKMKGKKYHSRLMHWLVLGNHNKRWKPNCTKNDWLTKDAKCVDNYNESPYCNFTFTVGAYMDLFDILMGLSVKKYRNRIPSTLPILLVSGADDPIGNYSVGVCKVKKQLEQQVEDIEMKLYEEDRHEILNETDKDVVFHDILDWIERHYKKSNKN